MGRAEIYAGVSADAQHIRLQRLTPLFWEAKPIQVTLQTQPPDLQILADRTPYVSKVNLEWGWATTHTLGALPAQSYAGIAYVFDSWSDGGAINHDFKVPAGMDSIVFTAKFLPAATVGFVTSPPGLALSIDARQNWLNYNFVWA